MPDALNFSGRKKLPLILQSENTECGLICLAMISQYFGDRVELSRFRRVCDMGIRGTSLGTLMRAANQHHMICRTLRCELEELRLFKEPVILHWDFNHYVVLKKCSMNDITIHDPAVGIRKLKYSEVNQHFTGVVLELIPDDAFKPTRPGKLLGFRDFLQNVRGITPVLLQILVLAGILQFIAILSPFYTQLVIDEVLVKRDVDLLLVLGLGFGFLSLISVITDTVRGWANIYLSHQLSFQFGARLFKHLVHLPVSFFQKRHMGDIVSRFQSLHPIQDFITSSAITVLLDGAMAFTTLIIVFVYSPILAGLVIAALFLDLVIQLAFFAPVKGRSNEQLVAEAKLDSNFMETIRVISTIKRYNKEQDRISNWQNNFCDAINANIKVDRLKLLLNLLGSSVAGISGVAVIYFGARQVLSGQMSIGMLFAFIAYKNHLQNAVLSLVSELMKYLMLSLHFERLGDIKLELIESHSQPLRQLSGAIRLNSISFRYEQDAPCIIEDLSLALEPGDQLAIYGSSGSGKSTIMGLLQSDLMPTSGEIYFDNLSARTLGIQSIRENCASIMQGDQLFSGSLKNNITFGDVTVDWYQLERAATLALVHEDILELPMAYESLVGEMGSGLSAGQIQRVLIARALYRKPKILFLDEGTAHLDRKTASTIMQNIRSLNMTCVFVTHQKAELGFADFVLSIKAGKHKVMRVR